jgi:hypothetical protein
MAKTTTEKIQSQLEYIKQQENLLRKLKQQAKTEERTARNKRLIHWGIAVEGVLKSRDLLTEPYMTDEEVGTVFAKGLTSKVFSKTGGKPPFPTDTQADGGDNGGDEN